MKKKILSIITAVTLVLSSCAVAWADGLDGFDFGGSASNESSGGALSGFDFGDDNAGSNGSLGGFDFGDDTDVTPTEPQKPQISVEEVSDDCNSIETNIESRYREAYELLCSLGITDKDTVFDTTKYMTRKKFAVLVAKLMQLSPEDASALKFTDVDPADADAPYIAAVYNAGIMIGVSDTYFGASNKVTYDQLLKVLVVATGYRLVADAKGGYSAGYSTLANNLKITKDLGVMSNEMTNGNVIKAIFNALFVNVNEIKSIGSGITYQPSDETYMEYYFGITRFDGFFNEYYGTNIMGISYCEEDEIAVSESLFKLGETTCPTDLLGKFVTVYSKKDENSLTPTIVLMLENEKKDNKEITISCKDLDRIAPSGTISYTENDKRKNISVKTDSKVIYNGAYMGKLSNLESKYLTLNSGNVKALCSDDSGKYNVIIITQYENFVVKSANKSTYKIIFQNNMKLGSDNFAVLDPDDDDVIVNYLLNGEKTDFSSVKAGYVVSISKSPNKYGKTVYNVYIGAESLKSVTIETIGDDFCVIDGEEYPLAYNYGKANTESIEPGMTTTALMTYFNEFFAIDNTAGSDLTYGFLTDYKKFGDSGLNPKISLQLYTSKDAFEELTCADKFTVKHTKATDGGSDSYATVYQTSTTYTLSDFSAFDTEMKPLMYVVNKQDASKTNLCGQLIGYKLDKNGKIKEIHISDDLSKARNYRGYDSAYFSLDAVVGADSLRSYNGGVGPKMFYSDKTVGVAVQDDIGTKSIDEKIYSWGSYSSAYNALMVTEGTGASDGYLQYSRIYNVGANRNIGFVCTQSSSGGTSSLTEDRPFIIEDIVQAVDTDGEKIWKVTGMKAGNAYTAKLPYDKTEVKATNAGAYKGYYRSDCLTAADLQSGDIIEIGKDISGFMTTFVLYYRLGDGYNEMWNKTDNDGAWTDMQEGSRMSERYTAFGRVEEREDDVMIMRVYPDSDTTHGFSWNRAARFLNTNCMLMEVTNGNVKVKKVTSDEFNVGDEVFVRNWYHSTYSAVVIRQK